MSSILNAKVSVFPSGDTISVDWSTNLPTFLVSSSDTQTGFEVWNQSVPPV